jgi:DNA-binding beta-propeller fold protein YncE
LITRARLRLAVAMGTMVLVASSGPPAVGATGTLGTRIPTGQEVRPAGRIIPLLAFPSAAALSPDGATVVVVAGRPVLTINQLPVSLMVIDAKAGTVKQVIKVGDALQSIAFLKDGSTAFIAGGVDRAVHTLVPDGHGGFKLGADLPVPACDMVVSLALDRDQQGMWASCPAENSGGKGGSIVHLSLAGAVLRRVAVAGPGPVAVSRDGSQVFAASWRGNSITVADPATGASEVVPVNDHPSALLPLADGRLVVAGANDASLDTLGAAPSAVLPPPGIAGLPGTSTAVIAPPMPVADDRPIGQHGPGSGAADGVQKVSGKSPAVVTQLGQVGRRSDSPNAIVQGPDGRIYVSLGADNAVAVLDPSGNPSDPWRLAGLLPTGWYPLALAIAPDGRTLHVVTARGLGHSAAATAPYIDPDPESLVVDSAYGTVGTLESITLPDALGLAGFTAMARLGIARHSPPPGSPLALGRSGPIQHVIYITRENKTYDADLADLHPGPYSGLALFGQPITPNLHALERQFVEAQAFYYPGFDSDVGHMWEDAGAVSDIYERAAALSGLSASWHMPSNYPATGLLATQLLAAGRTVRTYNEELAQQSGLVPPIYQADPAVFPNYNLHVSDTSREHGWETEFDQFESGHCTGKLATAYGVNCGLPDFEYVYLGEDHTTIVDEPGYPTIQAQVADNDYATGKLIDKLSHSKDWSSTLVIVVEDDPQGTGDHLSAYHGFIALAGPHVRRNFISTVNYSLTSVVAAIDDLMGLQPITDFATEVRPLDDLFANSPDLTPYIVDGSGVAANPFTPLPGASPASDQAHGVLDFSRPDATIPQLAGMSTWRQMRGMTEEEYLAGQHARR